MEYVVSALALGLFFVWGKFFPRRLSRIPYINFVPWALLSVGTATLATTAVGAWVGGAIGAVLGWVGGFFGIGAAVIAGAVVVLLTVAAAFDLVDGKVEGIAKTAIIALPFLVLVAVGPFADVNERIFDTVAEGGTDLMTDLVGR